MMPTPALDHGGLDRVGRFAERDDRAIVVLPRSRAERSRCCRPRSRSFAWPAIRSITVARSSVDDMSRPTSASAAALARAALGLVEQARVLQRDAHRRGERLQQAHFRFVERVLALVVLELDRTRRGRCRGWGPRRRTWPCRFPGRPAEDRQQLFGPIHHHGLARGQHPLSRAAGPQRMRLLKQPPAVLVHVQRVSHPGLRVAPANPEVVRVQHLAQLVADQVDDALEVERARHALLDAVDDGEFVARCSSSALDACSSSVRCASFCCNSANAAALRRASSLASARNCASARRDRLVATGVSPRTRRDAGTGALSFFGKRAICCSDSPLLREGSSARGDDQRDRGLRRASGASLQAAWPRWRTPPCCQAR